MAEPKVRFKRDDGCSYPAWAKQTVGEMTVELTDYKPLGCGLPLLTSSRTGLMFQDEYRGKTSTDNEDTLFSVVPRGAVTYRHMSDDDIFHFNINDLVDAGLVSKEYPVFNTVNRNNIRLLVEYLNSSNKFLEFCKAQKKGGTRTRLYFKVLKDFELMFPCVEEQQKIADFLSSVDEVITASEEEVANWETQKKAVMKKIFSQEVRFKRADGSDFPEWEEKVFTDVAQLINGRAYSADEMLASGKYMILRVGNLFSNNEYYYSDMELDDDKYIDEGDLIYAWSATFGPRIYHGEKCIYHYHIWKVIPYSVEKDYFLHFLYADVDNLQSELNGGTMKHITKEIMEKRIVPLPCKEEQHLIADFLSDFNEAITAAKKELELWKELKKGLLQQMFV